MVKNNLYTRALDPYKSTKLPCYTQTVDNSIKFKTRILQILQALNVLNLG